MAESARVTVWHSKSYAAWSAPPPRRRAERSACGHRLKSYAGSMSMVRKYAVRSHVAGRRVFHLSRTTRSHGKASMSQPGEAGACPICGKPRDEKLRPFCSKRCANLDLARWLTGDYA